MTQIVVPSLGESVSEAIIAKWLKKEGDTVKRDEPVVELETDKVTLEVNAPEDGVISKVAAQEGETVEVGAVIGDVSNDNQSGTPAAQQTEAEDTAPEPKQEQKQEQQPAKEQETKAAASAPSGAGAEHDVAVPQLGESVSEGTIAKWLKKEGEAVQQDEPVAEIETDKVTLEVNSPVAGTLAQALAKEGEAVEVGTVIAKVRAGVRASEAPAEKSEAPQQDEKPKAEDRPQEEQAKAGEAENALSPAVRKLVEENNLDPSKIQGSGKDGRLTKGDVLDHMEQDKQDGAESGKAESAGQGEPLPTPAHSEAMTETETHHVASRAPREERVRMTRLRQSIARRLKEAQNTAAMLTTFNEADMGAVMELRQHYKDRFEKKHGVKLGFMSFFVKACIEALQEFPAVNAEIDGEEVVYKNYYDISVAVSTPQGLVVPVLRAADRKSFAEIEQEIADLGTRAREGKITVQEMSGGTFTITNGGIFGSLNSTPILNPPQSGILGMHKIQERPMVMPDKSIEARPMMYLALSYDHRIVDGREAVSFLVRIKEALEDPQRLLLQI